MIPAHLKQEIAKRLNSSIISAERVSGGCINECFRIYTSGGSFFLKLNSAVKFPQLFTKEKNGLELLASHFPGIPKVIDCFEVAGVQALILQWIERGPANEYTWKQAGEQLAALHSVSHKSFGLTEDNYMGSVLQVNKPSENWVDFFITRRLQVLIQRCSSKNLVTANDISLFEDLYKRLPHIFDDHPPALVHGDLWNGNLMTNENFQPVLIDPAAYYGHPSVDIGMMKLFGGFDRLTFEAYNFHKQPGPQFEEQCEIANLYPLLVHVYLFGGSYLRQVRTILQNYH